jgi:hypothetical protein
MKSQIPVTLDWELFCLIQLRAQNQDKTASRVIEEIICKEFQRDPDKIPHRRPKPRSARTQDMLERISQMFGYTASATILPPNKIKNTDDLLARYGDNLAVLLDEITLPENTAEDVARIKAHMKAVHHYDYDAEQAKKKPLDPTE